MKRFTGHTEPWGKFVDVKANAPDLLESSDRLNARLKNKVVLFGSVTDPYQPCEAKYMITRKVLEKLVSSSASVEIMTKSHLVARDIDIISKRKKLLVSFSLSSLDENVVRNLEPGASTIKKRLDALRKLNSAGIYTVLFVSPIMPVITDWKEIIDRTRKHVDEYWFENLNFYPSIRSNVYSFLKKHDKRLVKLYREIYGGVSGYWGGVEKEINRYCKGEGLKYRIFFHHKNHVS